MFDFLNDIDAEKYVIPITVLLVGTLLGILFEKIILSALQRFAQNTKWKNDDIVINALKRVIFLWFFFGAILISIRFLETNDKFIENTNAIITALFILSITVFVSRVTIGFLELAVQSGKGNIPGASILVNSTRLLIFGIGFIVGLQTFGISITPIITAMGVGGVAIALALQETLSNLFAGMYIVASRKIKTKDYIQLASGEEGYVHDITWRNTTIEKLEGNMIIVPNQHLANSSVINFNKPKKEMAVLINVGVSYDSDLEFVEKITNKVSKEVMKKVEGGIEDFEPFIRYNTFGDFSINFTVILRCREFVDQYIVKHEFIKRLHKAYNENNIDIPFPVRTILTENGKEK